MAKYSVTVEVVCRETWITYAESADDAMESHDGGELVDTEVVSIEPMFADLEED